MQKSPKVAMLEVVAKATHHQRGAGCSTTPEMRSVSQLKLRRLSTSGTCAIRCSASLTASGAAAGAPSMITLLSFRYLFHQTGDAYILCVGHLRIRIAEPCQITVPRLDIQ